MQDGVVRLWSHMEAGTKTTKNLDGYSTAGVMFDDDTTLVSDSNGFLHVFIQPKAM